jgi:hypothetical protein
MKCSLASVEFKDGSGVSAAYGDCLYLFLQLNQKLFRPRRTFSAESCAYCDCGRFPSQLLPSYYRARVGPNLNILLSYYSF